MDGTIILLVLKEDSSQNMYLLRSNYSSMLKLINNKKFLFSTEEIKHKKKASKYINTISCEDKTLNVAEDVKVLLQKFRHGRYTSA